MRALLERLEALDEAKKDRDDIGKAIIEKGVKHSLFRGIEKEVKAAITAARRQYSDSRDAGWGSVGVAEVLHKRLVPVLKELGPKGEKALQAVMRLKATKQERPLRSLATADYARRRAGNV